MATMNIKDPRVHELAGELARLRGTTATAAVRSALEEALARELRSQKNLGAALSRLQERARLTKDTWLSDGDLYDEAGLPK